MMVFSPTIKGSCRCLLLFLSLAVAALPAYARELDERFVTGDVARLDVSNISGEISIAGWDKGEIYLTGELDDRAEIELQQENQRVNIKVIRKKGVGRMGDSDLNLKVPFDSELSVYAVSSDLEIKKVIGVQRLEVVSGDIRVTDFESDLRVKSVSGDILLRGKGQATQISIVSVSGDTEVFDSAGEVDISNVSGSTELTGGNFDRVEIHSTSGSVVFKGGLSQDSRFGVESVSGNVALDLDDGSELDVEVETFSGSIRNCSGEKSVRKSKYGPGQLLQYSRGASSQDVRISSMSGDVNICAR